MNILLNKEELVTLGSSLSGDQIKEIMKAFSSDPCSTNSIELIEQIGIVNATIPALLAF